MVSHDVVDGEANLPRSNLKLFKDPNVVAIKQNKIGSRNQKKIVENDLS